MISIAGCILRIGDADGPREIHGSVEGRHGASL
jgi:hypothetical protein